MNSSLALVIYGNAYLQGHKIDELQPDCPAFIFEQTFNFKDKTPSPFFDFAELEADTPLLWFEKLKTKNVHGLRIYTQLQNLHQDGDYVLAGFVNSGSRFIVETCYDNEFDLWESSLRAIRQNDDSKIWQTTCYRLARRWKRNNAQGDLNQAIAQMDDALADIINFSVSAGKNGGAEMFLDNFQNAQKSLHGNIIPAFTDFPSLSPTARQLMISSIHASVFGAMGSWNDLGDMGEAKDEYKRVSAKLYSAINTAFTAGANSSFVSYS